MRKPEVTMRIPVTVYDPDTARCIAIEPSWVLRCPTHSAVRYVRSRLKALMEELDGTIVVEDDEAESEAPAGPEAPK